MKKDFVSIMCLPVSSGRVLRLSNHVCQLIVFSAT